MGTGPLGSVIWGETVFRESLGTRLTGRQVAKAPVRLSLKLQGHDRVGIVEGSCG